VEKRTAANWYWWLWLSPLLTLFALLGLVALYQGPGTAPIGVLGSSLLHLILLVPALNKKSAFVRWHGRQALLLAGARTTVPLVLALIFGISWHLAWGLILVVPLWLAGTLLSQLEARRGLCWLMRRAGRADEQPAYVPPATALRWETELKT
jgi:uncharacterized membrane protein